MGVDYEQRVDFDRLRALPARAGPGVARGRASAGRSCSSTSTTSATPPSTWIGGALGDKMTRYALLAARRRAAAVGLRVGGKHHKLYSPWLDPRRTAAPACSACAARSPRRVGLMETPSPRSRECSRRPASPTAGRRRHRRAAVPLRDAAAGPARRRRPAAHARRPGDQVRRRDHAAHPGRRDGRRRLPGHRRGAEARAYARTRSSRWPTSASTRWVRTRSRRSTRLGGAVQPAPAQLHRPADPPGRPGVLRHHPLLQRLPDLLLPHLRVGMRTPAQRDAYTQAREWMDAAIAWSSPASGPTRSPRCWPRPTEFGLRRTRWRRSGCSSATASVSGCTSARSSRG